MAQIDLSNYNLGELKGLQFDVEKELKERQRHDLRKAREQVMAIVQEAGMSVDELLAERNKDNAAGKGGGRGRPKKAGPEA
ncbi:H-NS family nucleoid-associated regulatory protein [Massilia brevitalea]|uniref:H-NS family nucleoid-associated regulatory protein n=1 Tax=Massilia brevitalea TaxID=442526 RepID=UPI00273835B3|nr:H-NS family nucleoid-associated regulatory protein [Massilia brevitalea]